MKEYSKILCTLFIVPLLFSLQVPSEYLNDIQKTKDYLKRDQLRMDIKYSVFAQAGNTLLDQSKGTYELSGNQYEYVLGEISIIQNEMWNVYMDKTDKLLVVKEKEDTKTEEMLSLNVSSEGINTLTRIQKNQTYVYTMTFQSPVSRIYSSIDIHCSKNDFRPLKVILNYAYETEFMKSSGTMINDKLRLEIVYEHIGFTSKTGYSTNHLFTKEGNELQLSEEYSNYKLIDQRIEYRIPQN